MASTLKFMHVNERRDHCNATKIHIHVPLKIPPCFDSIYTEHVIKATVIPHCHQRGFERGSGGGRGWVWGRQRMGLGAAEGEVAGRRGAEKAAPAPGGGRSLSYLSAPQTTPAPGHKSVRQGHSADPAAARAAPPPTLHLW